MSPGGFVFFISVVDVKTVHSVFRFIGWVLAIGGSVVFGIVLGSLFQRERARELVAEIGRVMKGDCSQIRTSGEFKEEPQERMRPRADL
jgi:hypothetical protein